MVIESFVYKYAAEAKFTGTFYLSLKIRLIPSAIKV